MLRHIKTDDLVRKILAYKNKPEGSWKRNETSTHESCELQPLAPTYV